MQTDAVEHFIALWTANDGGAERANFPLFLGQLCRLLGVPEPDPASAATEANDYVFERAVKRRESEAVSSSLRIDLYKRGCFILEAKQSRLPQGKKALVGQQSLPGFEIEKLGRRTNARGWDVMMLNARRQAEDYVFHLDKSHPAPPFIIVCDVGHCIELYADFSGTGRAYTHYPDRRTFRIFLEELKDPAIRDRLIRVWTDPHSLDPSRVTAQVTREIAKRLAQVSKELEKSYPPEEVAHFLMRCIFTMFAQGVDLLPKGEFTALIEGCLEHPKSFAPLLDELWHRMDEKEEAKRFFSAFRRHVRHFNGNLFRGAKAFPLEREEIGELLEASRKDWTLVDPAIFGTLLEQALDPRERSKLGAHYTPRAYVERLVRVTVMEPLREDWREVLLRVQDAVEAKNREEALRFAKEFHRRICATRVLDPACGTGNFLYVALEMLKVLEGEVLEKLAELGDIEDLLETVDPHQFLGLELNPRAAAIAELVVWIGYLQQHYRTRTGHPAEPILRAFRNINFGQRAGYDAVLTWDGYPAPAVVIENGRRVETTPNARRPEWPDAEFVVGNPPFIGGKDIRSELGSLYAEALWAAHPQMNRSADFVMYWWDRAAEVLARPKSSVRRVGLITTNSIRQVFQRRVIERHLTARTPVSIVFAVPDHPWTKATEKTAAVRIAMTVMDAGTRDGVVTEVVSEDGLDTDPPVIVFETPKLGRVQADLTIVKNLALAAALRANDEIAHRGVQLMGAGFIVTASEAAHLGLGRRQGLDRHIRLYRNGRDLTGYSRDVMVVDLYGLGVEAVRRDFPEVYQHLAGTVRTQREAQVKRSPTVDARQYAQNWWLMGKPRPDLRAALEGLPRYIATVETAKHRVFQFLDASILPDNRLVCFALAASECLAILSSRIHIAWTLARGGLLEDRPIYTKSLCFDPFPFPAPSGRMQQNLRRLGDELDAFRKGVLAEHPDLTLTGLYNVLQKLRTGEPLSAEDEDVKQRGLVGVLADIHDAIDRATADAYGWPHDLADAEILERLVALNRQRAAEEAAGTVRWLRPDFQIPRLGTPVQQTLAGLDMAATVVAFDRALPAFPKDRYEQPLAVKRLLAAAARPLDAEAVSRAFKGPWKPRLDRIRTVLGVLARYGDIEVLPDGRYAARRAA